MKLKCPACGKVFERDDKHSMRSRGNTLCGTPGKIVKMRRVK